MSDLKPTAHSKTKDQLLEHAVPLFAKKGYRDATCSDLSKQAGANIAAINYHFGSKENLYRLSLRRAFELADAKYAFDGGLAADAAPEDKLLALMDALIRRIFDQGPAGYLSKMMAHQASRPTAPQELVMEEIMKLQGNHLLSTIQEITGELPQATLQAAKVNIIALCVFPSLAPTMCQLLFTNTPTAQEIDHMVQRQYRFALAGLRTLIS